MEKDILIKKEVNALKKIYKGLSKEKMILANRLIEKSAFMKITLEELEEKIKSEGPTYKMEQGQQKMIIENPAQKSYNTMINRYHTIMKQLIELLNEKEEKEMKLSENLGDDFEEFIES